MANDHLGSFKLAVTNNCSVVSYLGSRQVLETVVMMLVLETNCIRQIASQIITLNPGNI